MVKEHLNRDQKHVLDIFKMAAEVLEEIELKGERGNFTLYLSKEDVKGLEDAKNAEKLYIAVAASQEITVPLQGECGRLEMKCTPAEYERIRTDPVCADYYYKQLKQKLPFGPLRKYVPPAFWVKLSDSTLDSYLANTEKDADILREKNPGIDVIVRKYCDKVFEKVKENLNDHGNQAIESMSPWIINTLIDFDDFDKFIMNPVENDDESDVHAANISTDYQEPNINNNMTPDYQEHQEEDVFIWTTPRVASSIDRKAILCLIDILSSPAFDKKLKDKKSKKKTVWKEIAEELNKRGFKLKTDDPGEKVHQKWRNMEREYRSFIEHKKKTGEGKKKQPEFFDELHKMLSVRHSVNPVAISDTTGLSSSLSLSSAKAVTPNKSSERKEGTADAISSLEPDCNNNKPKEKQSDTCATPYKRKRSLKSEKNEEVINLIKSMHEENKRSEERRFEREIQFFDSLQKEIANQHKERMNATYDLIEALKNTN